MKRLDEGRNYLSRALVEARAIGDLISQCKALTGLGRIEHEQGRLVEGAALAEETLKVARGAKDPHAITICLFNGCSGLVSA